MKSNYEIQKIKGLQLGVLEEWVKVFDRAENEVLQICVSTDSGATMMMDVTHAIQSEIVMGGKNK